MTPDERLRQLDDAGFDRFAKDFVAERGQSRWHSAIEAATNIVVGVAVSWVLTYTVLPFYGYAPSIGQATEITGIFTVASMIRSYGLRRIFNRWHQ